MAFQQLQHHNRGSLTDTLFRSDKVQRNVERPLKTKLSKSSETGRKPKMIIWPFRLYES